MYKSFHYTYLAHRFELDMWLDTSDCWNHLLKSQELPDYIREMTYLREWHIRGTNIHKIPAYIVEFQELCVLELPRNGIEELPAMLGEWDSSSYLIHAPSNYAAMPSDHNILSCYSAICSMRVELLEYSLFYVCWVIIMPSVHGVLSCCSAACRRRVERL